MSYLVDKPPTEDAVLKPGQRSWELPVHRPNLTASRAAFKTYSTCVLPFSFRFSWFLNRGGGGGGRKEGRKVVGERED